MTVSKIEVLASMLHPRPVSTDGPSCHDLVVSRLESLGCSHASIDLVKARKEVGLKRYGVPLTAFNGRNALAELLQEIGDAYAYLAQCHAEEIISEDQADLIVLSLDEVVETLTGSPTGFSTGTTGGSYVVK